MQPRVAFSLVISVMATIAAATMYVRGTSVESDSLETKFIPCPGGEIAITGPDDQRAYDTYKYAPVRRAGDYIYVSGVVIGRLPDGPRNPETFKTQARIGFQKLRARLRAFDAAFADVVMVNTFHDWTAPEFGGDRLKQFNAFNEVKEEFMGGEARPAWTAVGTSGLIREAGIVEVQMIAYSPRSAGKRR